jgi:preprotein translocase subunit SecA
MITKLLESAQRKVESHHFDMRKHLLEYDDVLNRHRQVIYKKRRDILEQKGTKESVLQYIENEIEFVVSFHTTKPEEGGDGDWSVKEIIETAKTMFPVSAADEAALAQLAKAGEGKLEAVAARENIVQHLLGLAKQEYAKIEEKIGNADLMRDIEKGILLRAIDTLWVDHLVAVDYLRTGIGLRGYGQRDPLVEYKKETFFLFQELQTNIQKEVVYSFFKIGLGFQLAPTIMASDRLTLKGAEKEMGGGPSGPGKKSDEAKVGRNDPCPCGSGKKYKKCHGA